MLIINSSSFKCSDAFFVKRWNRTCFCFFWHLWCLPCPICRRLGDWLRTSWRNFRFSLTWEWLGIHHRNRRSRRSWRVPLERGMSGFPSWTCCLCGTISEKRGVWMDVFQVPFILLDLQFWVNLWTSYSVNMSFSLSGRHFGLVDFHSIKTQNQK